MSTMQPAAASSAGSVEATVAGFKSLSSALESGAWLDAAVAGLRTVKAVCDVLLDPIGALVGAGIGWIMEHLQPIKGWLEKLLGNKEAIAAYAGIWSAVSGAMRASGDDLSSSAARDTAGMSGAGVAAYQTHTAGLSQQISSFGDFADAVGGAVAQGGNIVENVYAIVKRALTDCVTTAIKAVLAAMATFGIGMPAAIATTVNKVRTWVTEVLPKVTGVVTTLKALISLADGGANVSHGAMPGLREFSDRVESAPGAGGPGSGGFDPGTGYDPGPGFGGPGSWTPWPGSGGSPGGGFGGLDPLGPTPGSTYVSPAWSSFDRPGADSPFGRDERVGSGASADGSVGGAPGYGFGGVGSLAGGATPGAAAAGMTGGSTASPLGAGVAVAGLAGAGRAAAGGMGGAAGGSRGRSSGGAGMMPMGGVMGAGAAGGPGGAGGRGSAGAAGARSRGRDKGRAGYEEGVADTTPLGADDDARPRV